MSSTIILPSGGEPDITYRVLMDGANYEVTFKYLQRETNVSSGNPIFADEWRIIISLSGGNVLVNTPLKTNRDILAPYRYKDGCPQGVLVLLDLLAEDLRGDLRDQYRPERVTYEDLGADKRFRLVYFPDG